jgi:2TM domain-containing protein
MSDMGTGSGQAAERGDLRFEALQRLRKRRDFRTHLTAYVLVNFLLISVWLVVGITAGAWFPWPIFPLLGWGIGLAFHARAVYESPIDEAAIQEEMARMRERRS